LQEATRGSPALSTAAAFPEQSQSPLQGSVPSGQASPEVLPLSLNEAIERGLKHNLGLLLSDQASRAARGQRWVALSALLPNLEASATEQVQQISLAASGIKIPNFPRIVGPFGIFDLRAFLSQRVLDWNATETARAAAENVRAAEYSYKGCTRPGRPGGQQCLSADDRRRRASRSRAHAGEDGSIAP